MRQPNEPLRTRDVTVARQAYRKRSMMASRPQSGPTSSVRGANPTRTRTTRVNWPGPAGRRIVLVGLHHGIPASVSSRSYILSFITRTAHSVTGELTELQGLSPFEISRKINETKKKKKRALSRFRTISDEGPLVMMSAVGVSWAHTHGMGRVIKRRVSLTYAKGS